VLAGVDQHGPVGVGERLVVAHVVFERHRRVVQLLQVRAGVQHDGALGARHEQGGPAPPVALRAVLAVTQRGRHAERLPAAEQRHVHVAHETGLHLLAPLQRLEALERVPDFLRERAGSVAMTAGATPRNGRH
jgi:hypothetical protein